MYLAWFGQLVGVMALAAALALFAGQSFGNLLVFVYGASVALVGSGLLVWRWRQGLHVYRADGQWHLNRFNRSFMERFFVVVALLALGFLVGRAWNEWPARWVLGGFVAGQLAWVIALAGLRREQG